MLYVIDVVASQPNPEISSHWTNGQVEKVAADTKMQGVVHPSTGCTPFSFSSLGGYDVRTYGYLKAVANALTGGCRK